MASPVPGWTSIRLPPLSGATKYSLAMPRSEPPPPGKDWLGAGPLVDVRTAATGRAERTVMTIEGVDWVICRQPEYLVPLHNSHCVPAGMSTLRTGNASPNCVGPTIVRRTPLKRVLL